MTILAWCALFALFTILTVWTAWYQHTGPMHGYTWATERHHLYIFDEDGELVAEEYRAYADRKDAVNLIIEMNYNKGTTAWQRIVKVIG